jgi:two-component system, OmpR family, sensor histidine kinase VicK
MTSTSDTPANDPCEDLSPDTTIAGELTPALVIAEDGTICHTNQAAADLLGRAADDLADRKLASLVVDAGTELALLRRSRDGENIRDEDLELLRSDGSRVVVQVTAAAPARDASPWQVHWLLHDISAERDAEERDARLAAIIHDSDDAIITKRMDGVITSWNPAAARLFGYTAEEMIGQPISVIMPPEMADEFPGIMRRLALGEHIDHYETLRRAKDGHLIDVSVSISPIRNSAGRIVGASDITRDITGRRELERKQREFLTMVAHDLRSPLTSIKGFAQLMQRRETYSPTAIAAILNQVRLVERLVEDVLEITRLDENRQDVTFARVDLVELTRSIVDRTQALLPSDRIALHAPGRELLGRWDVQRIEQALDNVLSNAVKYAPTGPIDVSLAPHGDHVEIRVEDRGHGIAPENLPYVFERFYRAPGDSSNTRGVGLGLTITRNLIQAHGGSITIESELGEGTAVTITLPWDSSLLAEVMPPPTSMSV